MDALKGTQVDFEKVRRVSLFWRIQSWFINRHFLRA